MSGGLGQSHFAQLNLRVATTAAPVMKSIGNATRSASSSPHGRCTHVVLSSVTPAQHRAVS